MFAITGDLEDFIDIYTDVMNRLKVPTSDSTSLTRVKLWINERYRDIAIQRQWRWLYKEDNILIKAPETTGTATFTKDSATVSGTGTTFTNGSTAYVIKADGSPEIYTISAIGGATSITLNDAFQDTTITGGTFKLYQDTYVLPTDVEDLVQVWHEHYQAPMAPVGLDNMRKAQLRFPDAEGKAVAFTLVEDNSSGTRRMQIYPRPDEQYLMHIKYIQRITRLSNDTDEPLIPKVYRSVLVYGACADLARYHNDQDVAAYYESKYADTVVRMANDTEITDSYPILKVPDKYRRINLRSQIGSLGTYFDKYFGFEE